MGYSNISFQLTDDLKEQVVESAADKDISVSTWMREAARNKLQAEQ